MEERTVDIPSIHCEHCVKTIERELREDVQGLLEVHADAASKRAVIRWGPPASWREIAGVLEEIGFPPASAG